MNNPFNTNPHVEYGKPVRLAPQVQRITAPNASPMTFTGTQTYLVGDQDLTVIDPGPADEAHVKSIVDAVQTGQRIRTILVTHTHVDHSPAARMLQKLTSAPVLAFGPHGKGVSEQMQSFAADSGLLGGGEGADRDFKPTAELADGDVIRSGNITFKAIHTPGHLSNHLCYSIKDAAIFTGDMIMGWATSMVSPPDGDMTDFMASLEKLKNIGGGIFYPGHGHPITDPAGMIEWQIKHRYERETAIIRALQTGPKSPSQITELVYTDISAKLYPAAKRNVLAHLLGLVGQGRAEVDGKISHRATFNLTAQS
ncbi:MAG: MBL fold metallo-hydrolase [Pikeienuella sp.]